MIGHGQEVAILIVMRIVTGRALEFISTIQRQSLGQCRSRSNLWILGGQRIRVEKADGVIV
jgi:hypothetical protein